MLNVRGFAAMSASAPLQPFNFERRDPGPSDVQIDIAFCGVCHSDLHQVRNEWGGSSFPMVPGHEIVGRVSAIGKKVKRFQVGDIAGVGCIVDSCRKCPNCKKGLEQFCDVQAVFTYNSKEKDGKTTTQGGYSSLIVVDENYTLKISPKLPLERVAPLLCAGITTYSPLRHWKVGRGQRVGVLGLGGLGHMAVKLADSLGADVTVISTSKSKAAEASRLGADHFALSSDDSVINKLANYFDFIIDTVSAPHDLNKFLPLLQTDGTMILLGVPPKPPEVQPFHLIGRRRQLTGSLIGGIAETQEMLDYCAKKKVFADVEVIAMDKINQAYERMIKGDVRYRFSIDMKTL